MEEEEDLSAIALAAIARLRNLADKAKADSRSSTPRRSTSPTPFSRSDSIRQQEAAAPAEPAGPASHPIEMPDGLSRSSSMSRISSTQSLKSLLQVRPSTCSAIRLQRSVGCWWSLHLPHCKWSLVLSLLQPNRHNLTASNMTPPTHLAQHMLLPQGEGPVTGSVRGAPADPSRRGLVGSEGRLLDKLSAVEAQQRAAASSGAQQRPWAPAEPRPGRQVAAAAATAVSQAVHEPQAQRPGVVHLQPTRQSRAALPSDAEYAALAAGGPSQPAAATAAEQGRQASTQPRAPAGQALQQQPQQRKQLAPAVAANPAARMTPAPAVPASAVREVAIPASPFRQAAGPAAAAPQAPARPQQARGVEGAAPGPPSPLDRNASTGSSSPEASEALSAAQSPAQMSTGRSASSGCSGVSSGSQAAEGGPARRDAESGAAAAAAAARAVEVGLCSAVVRMRRPGLRSTASTACWRRDILTQYARI